MGRTRKRRSKKVPVEHLDHLPELKELRRWLSQKGWTNETKLKLVHFPETGRGVMASKNFRKNDTLITIPLNLMITYNTLQTSLQGVISPSHGQLEIHDLLATFLAIEKRNGQSPWREYINSLPQEPPPLPWLATAEELNLYPADLQIISKKKLENLEESMNRVRRSIKKHADCVLDEYLFKWGYVLVNTRAVYIRPDVVRNMSQSPLDDVLADEPKVALCPFLDMFNHSFAAANELALEFRDGVWLYELKTLSSTKKYDQIFISYGSHDNVKLLMEYGFYIPGNTMDIVQFELQELLMVLQVNLSERQYKFIKDHNFDKHLYVGYDGVSFNLKAVLFISYNEDVKNYDSVVYNSYPEGFTEHLLKWADKLLWHKAGIFKKDYENLAMCNLSKSCHSLILESFLCYRVSFISYLRTMLQQYVL